MVRNWTVEDSKHVWENTPAKASHRQLQEGLINIGPPYWLVFNFEREKRRGKEYRTGVSAFQSALFQTAMRWPPSLGLFPHC